MSTSCPLLFPSCCIYFHLFAGDSPFLDRSIYSIVVLLSAEIHPFPKSQCLWEIFQPSVVVFYWLSHFCWLVVYLPLWKIWVRQWEVWHSNRTWKVIKFYVSKPPTSNPILNLMGPPFWPSAQLPQESRRGWKLEPPMFSNDVYTSKHWAYRFCKPFLQVIDPRHWENITYY